MIYISTDYVFDGTNPPYSEDATTGPLGVLKRQGEVATLEADPNHSVLRIPILYGPVGYWPRALSQFSMKSSKNCKSPKGMKD